MKGDVADAFFIQVLERARAYGLLSDEHFTVDDAEGEAEMGLPDRFEALNRDFRYQLTCLGAFAPVYIARKISKNHFKIAGGLPGLEVSWQVAGIRHDKWATEHPLQVVVEKPAHQGS